MIKENKRKKVLRWSNNLQELSSKRNILVDLEYKIYIHRATGYKSNINKATVGSFEMLLEELMIIVLFVVVRDNIKNKDVKKCWAKSQEDIVQVIKDPILGLISYEVEGNINLMKRLLKRIISFYQRGKINYKKW